MWFLVLAVCSGIGTKVCGQVLIPTAFPTRKECIYAGSANSNETGAIAGSTCVKHDSGIATANTRDPRGGFLQKFTPDGTNDEPSGDGK